MKVKIGPFGPAELDNTPAAFVGAFIALLIVVMSFGALIILSVQTLFGDIVPLSFGSAASAGFLYYVLALIFSKTEASK